MEFFKNEFWKDIEGYEGLYRISSLGRVISIGKTKTGKIKPIHFMKELVRNGYVRISLTKDKNEYKASLHVLLALHFIPNPENKEEVNHKNGIRNDNRLCNLEWVTARENACHRSLKNGSVFLGVSFMKGKGKYRARAFINGKEKHLGLYDDPEIAYKVVLKELEINSINNMYISDPVEWQN